MDKGPICFGTGLTTLKSSMSLILRWGEGKTNRKRKEKEKNSNSSQHNPSLVHNTGTGLCNPAFWGAPRFPSGPSQTVSENTNLWICNQWQ